MADFSDEDDALLSELGVEVAPKKAASRTPREERIIAGFEEIQRFFDERGHAPRHGEEHEIFERLYATRLDRMRELQECRTLLEPLDHQGLLAGEVVRVPAVADDLDDDALLAELGVEVEPTELNQLRHVRSSVEKRAAEEVANRERCRDFSKFKPLFEAVQRDLDSGIRAARRFELKAEILPGRFFIVGGQKAYVAEMGELELTPQGRTDARLRVIFDNGTESHMLMRSLQRALNKDEAGRRITEATAGSLFSDAAAAGDEASGTIYVLRSKSDHPMVSQNRELVHKIGVTNMSVAKRIAGAHLQPTFLMAGVDVVATYELFNISRTKLENLIHRIFDPAKLEIEIADRFGRLVVPQEWFLVPLFVVDEAVEKIRNGTIANYAYDPKQARLIERT